MIPTDLRAAVARAYPDENWDNGCAGFAYLCCRLSGTVRQAYPSATDARLASQIVSTDPAAAPPGAFHHWSYWARLGGVYQDWGHVGMALGGGRCVMTNPEAGEWDWGVCLGETDVASWTARRRGIVTYLGWSHTYGANTASITTGQTAGDNSTPFNPQEDDMADSIIVSCTDPDRNGIWMMGPSHIHQFTAEEWKYVQDAGAVPGMKLVDCGDNPRAFDLLRNIFQAQSLSTDQVRAAVEKALAGQKFKVNVDYAKIADAVNDDAAKRLAG